MDVWYAVSQYEKRQGMPAFDEYAHPAISVRALPYVMRVPASFLPWDRKNGVIALRRKDKQLAVCRCGVVLAGIYFQLENATQTQVAVALKVMDQNQLQLQRDDVENEVRVMAQLQMAGVDAPLANPYVIRWEHGQDAHNQYLATEYIANGSLQSYAHKRIRHLMVKHLQDFVTKHGEGPTKLECVSYVYRGAGHEWMRESLQLFQGIIRGLTYLHAQGVAHLDLDIYNVAIDKELLPRIIDYGSSQLMDHRQVVGAGYVGIKCKPVFVAPEVREHAKHAVPRPGFLGPQADLWSVGVVVRNASVYCNVLLLASDCPLTNSVVCLSCDVSSWYNAWSGASVAGRRTSRLTQSGARRSLSTLMRPATTKCAFCAKTSSRSRRSWA